MNLHAAIRETPWDTAALGVPCFEITDNSRSVLEEILRRPGHYSIKIDPLAPKALLHEFGFYYCDTLLEPQCTLDRFKSYSSAECTVNPATQLQDLTGICNGAFIYGRYHRDFNVDSKRADLRYNNWLKQLFDDGKVFELRFKGKVAGFIASEGAHIVLHAITDSLRGKGLAKYWWSIVCSNLFQSNHQTISSSISASNLSVLNLYASLGFTFRKAQDVYHRLAT